MSENNIKISDEVIAIVAGVAAMEVQGMAGMSNSLVGGISELLGKKNLSKGVKIAVENDVVFIDLFIIVEYGSCIPDVAVAVQNKVKEAVESMTGMTVAIINVNVEGIKLPEEDGTQVKPTTA